MSNVDNYFAQPDGGATDNELVVGGTMSVGSGATVTNAGAVTQSGAINFTGDVSVEGTVTANAMVLAATAGAANVCEVEIALVTGDGATRTAQPHLFDVWLSDAASGAGTTGTTASGTVTAKAASGEVIDTYTAKKSLRVQALATGIFTLEITDTAKTAFYVCAQNPCTGSVHTLLLATGDYGA